MKIKEREKACLKVLEKLPINSYVLIGGYATSSFDFPRFSVDLDLVIREKDKQSFIHILDQENFSLTIKTKNLNKIYRSQFLRFEKKVNSFSVSVDLMINAVVSRQTDVAYSFSYLFRNSEIREVVGSMPGLRIKARIASREMLIALKFNSLRLTDIRDIITLCFAKIDNEKLKEHLRRCPQDKIKKNVHTVLKVLKDENHKDSIKGVFSLTDPTYQKITRKAEKTLKILGETL